MNNTTVISLVLNSSLVAKSILLILFGLSVVSWAIMLQKWFLFRQAHRQNQEFLKYFRMGIEFARLDEDAQRYHNSPIARVFKKAYARLKQDRRQGDLAAELRREALSRQLERSTLEEINRLQKNLTFLATTSSVSPFFGLLGTVWGVMRAFLNIGAYGSSNIVVVAPGIAEALITTVAGLGAAIPAVIAYNYLVGWVRDLADQGEGFVNDMLIVCTTENQG